MASKISSFFPGLIAPSGEDVNDEAGVEDAVEYQGYLIRPVPRKQGSQWLTSGVIIKQGDEPAQEHPFVRADTLAPPQSSRYHTSGSLPRVPKRRGSKPVGSK